MELAALRLLNNRQMCSDVQWINMSVRQLQTAFITKLQQLWLATVVTVELYELHE